MMAQREDVYESADLPTEDPNAKFVKPEKTSPDEEVELVRLILVLRNFLFAFFRFTSILIRL